MAEQGKAPKSFMRQEKGPEYPMRHKWKIPPEGLNPAEEEQDEKFTRFVEKLLPKEFQVPGENQVWQLKSSTWVTKLIPKEAEEENQTPMTSEEAQKKK